MIFNNRYHAGQALGDELKRQGYDHSYLLLGLPRGGVPVACAAAARIAAPFDIFVVRKLGVPSQPELAMGAISQGDKLVVNHGIVSSYRIGSATVDEVVAREKKEVARRLKLYRASLPELDLRGQKVVLVDDGLATGASMRAAALAVEQHKPQSVHIAVPVGSKEAIAMLSELVPRVLCLCTPEPFLGVGRWYRDFAQTSDREVKNLLQQINVVSSTQHPTKHRKSF